MMIKNTTLSKPTKLLRLPEVLQITRLSKSSIYIYMNAGTFPKSIPLGARAIAWLESDIHKWIEDRISQRDQVVA